MDKDTKEILAEAERQGFSVSMTRKRHPAIYRNGVWVTTFSGTASDWRSVKNALADMKRAGFKWPPPPKKKRR
jgi:hypothetical protein